MPPCGILSKSECEKHGPVLGTRAPKPGAASDADPALSADELARKVYVRFESAPAAAAAAGELHGKQFDGREVVATFVSEGTYEALAALPCHEK